MLFYCEFFILKLETSAMKVSTSAMERLQTSKQTRTKLFTVEIIYNKILDGKSSY